MKVRRNNSLEFKEKVALVALKGVSRDFVLRTFGCKSTPEILTVTMHSTICISRTGKQQLLTAPQPCQPQYFALNLQTTTPAVPLPATD